MLKSLMKIESYEKLWNVATFFLAYAVIRITTPLGLGIVYDSWIYLALARSIHNGGEYAVLLSNTVRFVGHFPPIFPLTLTMIPEPIQFNGVYLQVIILALSAILVGKILRQLKVNTFLTVLAPLMMLISQPILSVHVNVWSEPLMILGTLLITSLVLIYIKTRGTTQLLLICLLSALLPLVRYAALFLLIPVALIYFLSLFDFEIQKVYKSIAKFETRKLGTAIAKSLVIFSITLLPYIYWQLVVKNHLSTVRNFAIHIIPWAKILIGFKTVLAWTLPGNPNSTFSLIFIAILIIFIGLLFLGLNSRKLKSQQIQSNHFTVEKMFILLVPVTYLVFLIISISTFDAATPLDTRILVPIFPFCLIYAASLLNDSKHILGHVWVKYVLYSVYALILFAMSFNGAHFIYQGYKNGQRNASYRLSNSPIMRAVNQLDRNTLLITNFADTIYAYTQRQASSLPIIVPQGITVAKLLERTDTNSPDQIPVCIIYLTFKFDDNPKKFTNQDSWQRALPELDVTRYSDGILLCGRI